MASSNEALDTVTRQAQSTLDLMTEMQVPAMPNNYYTWFEYLAGNNSALHGDIDRQIASGQPFTDEVCRRIFSEYFDTNGHDASTRQVQHETQRVLKDILAEVLSTNKFASDYSGKLETYSQKLAQAREVTEMRAIIGNVIKDTATMADSSRRLQDQLETTSAQAQQLRDQLRQTKKEALVDALTGLHNRRAFDQKLAQLFKLFQEKGTRFSAILFDIDHFKSFNDTYGHKVGDAVLKVLASVLKGCSNDEDLPARYGGEEFVVLLPASALMRARDLAAGPHADLREAVQARQDRQYHPPDHRQRRCGHGPSGRHAHLGGRTGRQGPVSGQGQRAEQRQVGEGPHLLTPPLPAMRRCATLSRDLLSRREGERLGILTEGKRATMSRGFQSRMTAARVAAMLALLVALATNESHASPVLEAPAVLREAPRPAPDHPGNVFLQGETVEVLIPLGLQERVARWRALDDGLAVVAQGRVDAGGRCRAGDLGVGWYRIEFLNGDGARLGFTTAAVLAPLAAPVPQDSPVCVDGALAWHEDEDPEAWRDFAQLAALAGVNWIRDRLDWRTVQTGPGEYVDDTKYDTVADIQATHGLKVLQVFHRTPKWAAGPDRGTGHFPADLRLAYRFCKAMAGRFRGQVQAWEPWNEANARSFGGHPIDTMCSYQKAAYLGFKAGAPEVAVGWNPIGGINTPALAEGILANQTWPYYDTYNFHSYDWPHAYEQLWGPARDAACGRPIWVTECDRGMKAEGGPAPGDFTHEFALRKAELMAHSYANSLFAGATRHFHFLLRHYQEITVQFGLLREDRTPRLSYVALAALGRLLAGARCLGRWEMADRPDVFVYAFRAQPAGIERDVLVVWAEKRAEWAGRGEHRVPWPLPDGLRVDSAFDYLGRPLGGSVPDALTPAAVFLLLPPGEAGKLRLRTVPLAPYRPGRPSPVVLQLEMPGRSPLYRKEAWTEEHERSVEAGAEAELQVTAYNLSDDPVEGTLAGDAPAGWKISPNRWDLALEPMERRALRAQLPVPATATEGPDHWITFRGDFGEAGQPVLSFRVLIPDS